ncbi:MAG: diacylglycerol kinase (ATP) [Nonlabens sp.]
MIKIAFLVNPISGKNRNKLEFKQINAFFDQDQYDIEIRYSSSKSDLERLTKECIDKSCNIIVASGGDGTVNTIAKFLVNSNIKLAILPRGSGNGLASHLGLSKSIKQLCTSIKRAETVQIDCGEVNGAYFFSNFALGYPADVIHRYDKDTKRGLSTYVQHSLKSFFSKKKDVIMLESSDKPKFCVLVSNTKYLGYNLSPTPKAEINNGLLDIVFANSRGDLALKMGASILFKSNFANSVSEVVLKSNDSCPAQLDGEPIQLKSPFHITVKKNGLKIII